MAPAWEKNSSIFFFFFKGPKGTESSFLLIKRKTADLHSWELFLFTQSTGSGVVGFCFSCCRASVPLPSSDFSPTYLCSALSAAGVRWDHCPAHLSSFISWSRMCCSTSKHTLIGWSLLFVIQPSTIMIHIVSTWRLNVERLRDLFYPVCFLVCGWFVTLLSSWSWSTFLFLTLVLFRAWFFRHRQEDIQDTKDGSCPFRHPILK